MFPLLLGCTILFQQDPPDTPETPRDTQWPNQDDETGGTDDTAKDTDGDGPVVNCQIREVHPLDGATDVYHRDRIRVALSEPDPGAKLQVLSATGSQGMDGDHIWFQPSPPLQPQTAYTADLVACGTELNWSFSTSEFGLPLQSALAETTFRVQGNSGTIIVPVGVGSILEQYIEGDILVHIDPSAQTATMAVAEGGGDQQPCAPTLTLPLTVDGPYLKAQGENLQVGAYVIDELEVSATVSPDGTRLGGVHIDALLNSAHLAPLVGEDADADAICDLVAGFGVECRECDDGQPHCLDVVAISGTGEVTEASVTATDTCLETCEQECDAACACAAGSPVGGALAASAALLVAIRRRKS